MAQLDDPDGARLLRNLRLAAGGVVLVLIALVVIADIIGASAGPTTLGLLIGALLTLLGLIAVPTKRT